VFNSPVDCFRLSSFGCTHQWPEVSVATAADRRPLLRKSWFFFSSKKRHLKKRKNDDDKGPKLKIKSSGAEHKVCKRRCCECCARACARDVRSGGPPGGDACRCELLPKSGRDAVVTWRFRAENQRNEDGRARVPTRTRARTHTHTLAMHARAHNHTHTSNARASHGAGTRTGAIAGRQTAADVVGDLLLVTVARPVTASEERLAAATSPHHV